MTRSLAAVILTICLAAPVLAQGPSGADDPVFMAAFDRALQGDDPTALTDIHAAAEAGNQAAILALPVVFDWLRPVIPFKDRKAFIKVAGAPMLEAFTKADPAAALWASGQLDGSPEPLLDRSFGLYDLGEAEKASVLFMTWINQTGGYVPLPDDFFDRPVPPFAMSFVLLGRLNDTGFFGTEAEADTLLATRLTQQDPAAWMAMAAFARLHTGEADTSQSARIARIIDKAGIPQAEALERMQAMVPVLKISHRIAPTQPAETARAAVDLFRTTPDFLPLESACAALCPATRDACTTAYVAAFGHPYGRTTHLQPLQSLIATDAFFATPRGRLVFLRAIQASLGEDPSLSPLLDAARGIDACLADAIVAALP